MRNPYIKFTSDLDLSKAVGGRIVGCWQAIKDGPWEVLVEKPQAKPRERKAAAARKPRAAKPAAARKPRAAKPAAARKPRAAKPGLEPWSWGEVK